MSDPENKTLPIPQSRSTAGLERTGGLTEYAHGLLQRLRLALEAEPRYSNDARVVPLVDLCGAIQLIQAGAANLCDVGRLDWLTSQHPPGATIRHCIDNVHRGTGIGSRAAMDDAMLSNVKIEGSPLVGDPSRMEGSTHDD